MSAEIDTFAFPITPINMNILLLGSGGREHALAWKMAQSHHCNELYIAPGNPGTAGIGTNLDLSVTDFEGIKAACILHKIGLVVVGPEEPLVKGIYDFFEADSALREIIVVGPSAKAAQLEGSKAFSKKFMQRHQIPTAAYAAFTLENIEEGKNYKVIVYKDGEEAHWNDNPLSIAIGEVSVNKNSKETFRLAAGGGLAISLIIE